MPAAAKSTSIPAAIMNLVVDSNSLKRAEVWGESDKAVHWAGAFALYGGHGATASSTIVYEIEPGKRLGWHTDATEETQYIIAGEGKLYRRGDVHARFRSGDAAPEESHPRHAEPRGVAL